MWKKWKWCIWGLLEDENDWFPPGFGFNFLNYRLKTFFCGSLFPHFVVVRHSEGWSVYQIKSWNFARKMNFFEIQESFLDLSCLKIYCKSFSRFWGECCFGLWHGFCKNHYGLPLVFAKGRFHLSWYIDFKEVFSISHMWDIFDVSWISISLIRINFVEEVKVMHMRALGGWKWLISTRLWF